MTSIVRRSNYWPFRALDDLWNDFTVLRFPAIEFPRLDIKEDDKEYCITAEVPGFTKEEINIEVNNGVLNISSEHKEEKEEKEEKKGYIYRERSERSFSRSIRIPENIKTEDMDARLDKGILTLRIPKKELPPPKKIEIKAPEEVKKLEEKKE
jgi:HSP20 family protein